MRSHPLSGDNTRSAIRISLIVGGCLLVSSCMSRSASQPAAPPRPPGPELRIGVNQPLDSLNPVTTVNATEANFGHFIWAGLLGVNASGQLFPMLAKSVPTRGNRLISPNGRSITFILRPGIKWSDGAAITPRDVIFGWRLAMKPWANLCPATCSAISDVSSSSPSRVTFALKRPFSPLLFDLPPVMPRHQVWRGSWPKTFRFLYSGSTTFMAPRFAVDGPFMAQTTTPSTVTFVPNPHWRLLSRPAFRRITVESFLTDKLMIAAQRAGRLDLTQNYQDFDFNRKIVDLGSLGRLHLLLYPYAGLEHLEPNQSSGKILSSVLVRQALNLAIDREALAANALTLPPNDARGLITYGPETKGRFDGIAVKGVWDPIRHRFLNGPSLKDAGTLLDRAGWRMRSDGFRYRVGCTTRTTRCRLRLLLLIPKNDYVRQREAQSLAANWRSIGVDLTVNYRQWSLGNLVGSFEEGSPCAHGREDLCLFSQLPGFDPQTDFQLEFTSNHIPRGRPNPSTTDINFAGIRDPVLNHIFAEAPSVYDLQKRASLFRRWQIRVAQDADWIPLYQRPVIVIETKGVRNFLPSSVGIEWNPWALSPNP